MTVTRTKCDPVGRPACAAVRLIADVLLSANLIKKLCRQSHIDDSRTPSALMQLTNELVNSIRLFCLKARGDRKLNQTKGQCFYTSNFINEPRSKKSVFTWSV